MLRNKLIFPVGLTILALILSLAITGKSQQAAQQVASRFDVTNYRIEAQLIPDQHLLRAGADITFI
ncbi:MAG TPA: hypothetical protein VF074_11025, partial [Pyrinomonadaceae bacterium]